MRETRKVLLELFSTLSRRSFATTSGPVIASDLTTGSPPNKNACAEILIVMLISSSILCRGCKFDGFFTLFKLFYFKTYAKCSRKE